MKAPAPEQFRAARERVAGLRESLERLASSVPWVEALHESFQEARLALERSAERLTRPTLRLATFGTTSSGKSTIVNALIGRQVAPMGARELSAGTCHILDADETALESGPPGCALWETGRFACSDEEIYERYKTVLLAWHGSDDWRRPMPEATIWGPLLPARWPELLGLPDGVGVELFDLPGLKNAQDQRSLALLQKQVNNAFGLVIFDYVQTDDVSRARLLEELKHSVMALGGRTDALVFVVNRVDLRGPHDEPLEERLASLQSEIRAVLDLTAPPTVLPLWGNLLFYAQTLWGPASLREAPHTPPEQARRVFADLSSDPKVIGPLLHLGQRDAALRKLLDTLGRDPASVEARRQFVHYAIQKSGGEELWVALHERVASSLAQIVIHPSVHDALQTMTGLLEKVKEACRIRRLASSDAAKEERAALERSMGELRTFLNEKAASFRGWVEAFVSAATQDTDAATRIRTFLDRGSYGEHFPQMLDIVSRVDGDLNAIIATVRDAILEKRTFSQLEELLREPLGSLDARAITEAVDEYRLRVLDQTSPEQEVLAFQRLQQERRELDGIGHTALRLYNRMREALNHRAGLKFQENRKGFEDGLRRVLAGQAEELIAYASRHISNPAPIVEAIRAAIIEPSDFPELDFRLGKPDDPREGTQTRQGRLIRDPSCFGHPEYELIEEKIVSFTLPGVRQMAEQWSSGVKGEHPRLWETLSRWMLENLERQRLSLDQAVTRAHRELDHIYELRLTEIESRLETEKAEVVEVELLTAGTRGQALELNQLSVGAA